MIAWERSRAASGYGIIWGDADRNKQEEFSAECHSVDWFSTELHSNKIEVITGLAVYLYDSTIL